MEMVKKKHVPSFTRHVEKMDREAGKALKGAARDLAKAKVNKGMLRLTAAVASLANKTPAAIASMLGRRRITGRPGTTSNCPLARMMHNSYGGQFVVGQKFIIRRSGNSIERVPTPENLASFVRRFDLSEFSSLIAPPPRCLQPKRTRPWRSGHNPVQKHGPRIHLLGKEAVRVTPRQKEGRGA
jgi:hypothetical protein